MYARIYSDSYESDEKGICFETYKDFDASDYDGIYLYLNKLDELQSLYETLCDNVPEKIHRICVNAASWCEMAPPGGSYEIEDCKLVAIDIIGD